MYYGLEEYAEVRPGNRASLVMFHDLESFEPDLVIAEGRILEEEYPASSVPEFILDSFNVEKVSTSDIPAISGPRSRIAMRVDDGSLITSRLDLDRAVQEPDPEHDLLKLAVVERYGHGNRAACIINGFGLKNGALASSVAHDCHNIIAVGVDNRSLATVINTVIENHGGLAAFDGDRTVSVSLEIGGIVADAEPGALAGKLRRIREKARDMGCVLTDPFASLSFMALEVIPHIKLTDRGLFDVDSFGYI